jgi:hypothetical protein
MRKSSVRMDGCMGRYIKKFTRIGSAGPTEERGFAIWAGYDIVGVEDDLSSQGLTRVDGWLAEELAARGVRTFLRVEPDDRATYRKLGIERER